MPTKRERGKQRRAKKMNEDSVPIPSIVRGLMPIMTGGVDLNLTEQQMRLSPNKIISQMKKGCNNTTAMVGLLNNEMSLYKSGAVSVALEFLNRCVDETLDNVMFDVGGDIKSPDMWLTPIFLSLHDKDACMHIAQNIGPLVSCMCNDTDRLFFKSNRHWRESIRPFSDIVSTLVKLPLSIDRDRDISASANKEIKREIRNTLLLHNETLLRSIVQWGFWGERPDIFEEIGLDDLVKIVSNGREAVETLLISAADNWSNEDTKSRVHAIATTSIINRDYDSNCMISFTEGFIRLLRRAEWDAFSVANATIMFRVLVEDTERVDKGVITEMVLFGLTTTSLDWALTVAKSSLSMLFKETKLGNYQQSDTHAAVAIRAGMFEMCLGYIGRFGTNSRELLSITEHIILSLNCLSFNKKSWKAIRHKKGDIGEELARLQVCPDITKNAKCKELVYMVRSIINLNGSYCCRCNKSLRRTEVKLCNGCGRMAYCSKACQQEDWLNGHKIACCTSYTPELTGQFQGSLYAETIPENERDVSKIKDLEININMIQLKLFLDHSGTILNQARALGVPLYDCVVIFQLEECPTTVHVMKYSDQIKPEGVQYIEQEKYFETFVSPESKKGFEDTRSIDNVMCLYRSYVLKGDVDLDFTAVHNIVLQRFFPIEWLMDEARRKNEKITTDLFAALNGDSNFGNTIEEIDKMGEEGYKQMVDEQIKGCLQS